MNNRQGREKYFYQGKCKKEEKTIARNKKNCKLEGGLKPLIYE